MTPERWRQMSELFDQILELPEEDRDAFLEAECAQDATLRGLVGKLLDADDEAGVFLDLEQHLAPRSLAELPISTMPSAGDRLGPYKLLRELGSGGMGVVYLASRDDASFKRHVAVKLIRQGRASEDARRRLHVERQILARLDHPRIAVLHDGGTTQDGLPYFVMEYVEGLPIDVYCDRHGLTTEARITLFLEVCEAVESAHRNLVVHRDLKPSNILVTADDGVPKLLDFGIAKLLDPDLVGVESAATEGWMRVLTPGYSSPEQIQGRPVSTASDVYSLGVLLFKLLTGRLPFSFEARSLAEIEELVGHNEPPRASATVRDGDGDEGVAEACRTQGVPPEQLARKLRGDLDSILAKALRTSPRHRYGTVDQLMGDLRRYECHLPVTARQGNLIYHVGKFLHRNALGAGIAVVFLAVILGFTGATVLQAERVRQERDRAASESRTKDAVIDFVVKIFEFANVTLRPGENLTVRQALEHGEEWFADVELEPEVQATLRDVIGRVYLSIGSQDLAAEQLRRVVDLQAELHGEDSPQAATARGLYSQALLPNEIDAGILEGRRAVEAIEARLGDGAPELVTPLNQLLTSLCTQGDYEAASELSPRALALARRWFGPDSAETALALTHSAAVLKSQKKFEEASRQYQEALTIVRPLLPDLHPDIADRLSNLASIKKAEGDLEGSARSYEELLEIQRRIYQDDHPDIARTLTNLSTVLLEQGREEESAETLREAVGMLHRTWGMEAPWAIWLEIRLAERLLKIGRPAEAATLLEERLAAWRRLDLGKNQKLIGDAEAVLSQAELAKASG